MTSVLYFFVSVSSIAILDLIIPKIVTSNSLALILYFSLHSSICSSKSLIIFEQLSSKDSFFSITFKSFKDRSGQIDFKFSTLPSIEYPPEYLPHFLSIKIETGPVTMRYSGDEIENISRSETEIDFSQKVLLPDIPKIKQSYLGYVDYEEYLKLIVGDNGEIRKNVFYDNHE